MVLGAISNDMKKIANDRQDDPARATDCQQLGTGASAASVHKIPDPTWDAQWDKAMGEIQKSADECSSAASTGDNATMQQALTDMTAADNDIIVFNQMTGGS